jgi:hypothetical protein
MWAVTPRSALRHSRWIDTIATRTHVRFTSNSVRTLAPERNDVMCQRAPSRKKKRPRRRPGLRDEGLDEVQTALSLSRNMAAATLKPVVCAAVGFTTATEAAASPIANADFRSTLVRRENDLSIPDQRRQAKSYCTSGGWEIVADYVEPGAMARRSFHAQVRPH